jgi:hypothetical protein
MFANQLLASLYIGASAVSALSFGIGHHFHTKGLPDYAQRNLNTIERIYNLTVYPNNAPIVNQGASAVPPGLFNDNATGRISPLGNFTGFNDSIECMTCSFGVEPFERRILTYHSPPDFFALAPTPQASAGQGIYRAEVVAFTSGCPEVATSLVYLRTGSVSDNGTLGKDTTMPIAYAIVSCVCANVSNSKSVTTTTRQSQGQMRRLGSSSATPTLATFRRV